MYSIAHQVLMLMYLLLPMAALARCIWRMLKKRDQRYEAIVSFGVLVICSLVFAAAMLMIYRITLRQRVSYLQLGSIGYFFVGFLLMLRGLRSLAAELSFRLMFVPKRPSGARVRAGWRFLFAQFLQAILAVAIGLPIILGTLITFRIKTVPITNVAEMIHRDSHAGAIVPISFQSERQLSIRGWWIPQRTADKGSASVTRDVVIVCLSPLDDFARMAPLIQAISNDGYAVLAIDLRASGASDGAWTGFGEMERQDILAAIRWLHENHTSPRTRIHLLGGGIGGAAVIGAAASGTPEAIAIESVVLINTYARLSTVIDSYFEKSDDLFVAWLKSIALPVMSAHAGSDLSQYSQAELLKNIWPKSSLLIHSTSDGVVSMNEGYNLLHAAPYPRKLVFVPGGHLTVYSDKETARIVLQFLKSAKKRMAI